VFEVPPGLLQSSDTRVRCGECMSIFDALDGLRTPSLDEPVDEPDDESSAADNADDSAELNDFGSSTLDATVEAAAVTRTALGPAIGDPADSDPEAADPAPINYTGDADDLDVTYTDFDLYSEDADLPEVVYLDRTHDTPEFDLDLVEFDADETFSDTLFAHDVTVDANVMDVAGISRNTPSVDVDFIADEAPREPLIFNYQDATVEPPVGLVRDIPPGDAGAGLREVGGAEAGIAENEGLVGQSPVDNTVRPEAAGDVSLPATASDAAIVPAATRNSSWTWHILLVLTLGLVLLGLYAYRERSTLHNHAVARPVMLAVCSVLECKVPSRVELDKLKLLQRSVYSHPTVDNALVINVAFRNDAPFEQRYPVLVIRLSDRNGRLVARRDFQPNEYFDAWQPGATIDAGKRLDISLEVSDPGRNAHSFELDFKES
jgi:hypothetical protein